MEGKVRSAFKEFKPSPEKVFHRIQESEKKGSRTVISHGNFKETYLQIALPISSAKDEDTPALDALSQILGGGESSRWVQKVKLEKALVTAIYASSYTPKDPGLFIIGATLPAENIERTIEAIWEEVNRLRTEGVTAEELHRVKVNIESDLIYGRQTVQGLAGKIGSYELTAGDVQFEKDYMRRIALLQNEEVQTVLKKYFKIRSLGISFLP